MIRMIQKNMNKKGFTLVELIIVIAVMAILAAIVVPRMTGITESFKEKADLRYCEMVAREVQVQIQIGKITPTSTSTELTATQYGFITTLDAPDSAGMDAFKVYVDSTNVIVSAYNGTTISTFVSKTLEHGGLIN